MSLGGEERRQRSMKAARVQEVPGRKGKRQLAMAVMVGLGVAVAEVPAQTAEPTVRELQERLIHFAAWEQGVSVHLPSDIELELLVRTVVQAEGQAWRAYKTAAELNNAALIDILRELAQSLFAAGEDLQEQLRQGEIDQVVAALMAETDPAATRAPSSSSSASA